LLPDAVAETAIRHAAWRLPRRSDRGATQGRSQIQPEHRLGLVESIPRTRHQRLLQHPAVSNGAEAIASVTRDAQMEGRRDAGPLFLRSRQPQRPLALTAKKESAPRRSASRGRTHDLQALLQSPIKPARRFLCRALGDERAREMRLLRTQRRLREREMDEVALGETAATAM